MNENDEIEMEVFRSGNYGAKGSYSEVDLQTIADDYRSDLLEAPLTFDHAQTGPAYGWVSRLKCEGDRLVAVMKGVPQAVRELVKAGHYKRRSVELFRSLPQTGRPYLRAVSLLGAATPEVKGLRDICFAANPDADCLQVSTHEAAAQINEQESNAASTGTPEVAALRAQLMESRLTAMFAELRADGYCLPERDTEAIRQLFAVYPADADAVTFSDGSSQPTLHWMSDFLRKTLLRAPLGEAAASSADRYAAAGTGTAAFSANTDPRSAVLHQAAMQLQHESPGLAYREALTRAASLRSPAQVRQ